MYKVTLTTRDFMNEESKGKTFVNGNGSRKSENKTTPDNCPICQDEMKANETIQTLPCSHKFHKDCIQKWIEMRNLCPLCKRVADTSQPVRELNDERHDLTQNMIEMLVHSSINPSGANFWMNLLQGYEMDLFSTGLLNDNIRNITIRSFIMGGDGNIEEDYVLGEDDNHPSFTHIFNEFRRHPSGWSSSNNNIQNHPGPMRRVRDDVRFNPLQQSPQPQVIPRQIPQVLQSFQFPTPQTSHCNEQAQCANCYAISCKHVIKRCSGCHQIRYCSRECQERNWAEHKEWCFAHRVENKHNNSEDKSP